MITTAWFAKLTILPGKQVSAWSVRGSAWGYGNGATPPHGHAGDEYLANVDDRAQDVHGHGDGNEIDCDLPFPDACAYGVRHHGGDGDRGIERHECAHADAAHSAKGLSLQP